MTARFASEYRINAVDKTGAGIRGAVNNVRRLERNNRRLKRSMVETSTIAGGFARHLLGWYTAIAGGRALVGAINAIDAVENRLRALVSIQHDVDRLRDSLFDVARETRQGWQGIATFYSRLAFAMRDTSISQEQLFTMTRTLNKLLVASGTTTREASGAMIQFSQAMASGKLSGEEYRSVSEQMPIVLDAIAKYLGKTRRELKGLANDQKLTTDIIVPALLQYEETANRLFDKTQVTAAQGWEMVKNEFVDYVHQLNRSFGVSKAVGEGLRAISENIRLVVGVLGGAGGAIALTWAWSHAATAAAGSWRMLRRAFIPFLVIEGVILGMNTLSDAINDQVTDVTKLAKEYENLRNERDGLRVAHKDSIAGALAEANKELDYFRDKAQEASRIYDEWVRGGENGTRLHNAFMPKIDNVRVDEWLKRYEQMKATVDSLGKSYEAVLKAEKELLTNEARQNRKKDAEKLFASPEYKYAQELQRRQTHELGRGIQERREMRERAEAEAAAAAQREAARVAAQLQSQEAFATEMTRRQSHERIRAYHWGIEQKRQADELEMERAREAAAAIMDIETQADDLRRERDELRESREAFLHDMRMRRLDELRGANADEASFEASMIKEKATAESAYLEGMYKLRAAFAGKSTKLARAVQLVEGALMLKKAVANAQLAFTEGLKNPPGPPWSYAQAFLALASGLSAAMSIGSALGIGGGGGGGASGGGGVSSLPTSGIGTSVTDDSGVKRKITLQITPGIYNQDDIVKIMHKFTRAFDENDDIGLEFA